MRFAFNSDTNDFLKLKVKWIHATTLAFTLLHITIEYIARAACWNGSERNDYSCSLWWHGVTFCNIIKWNKMKWTYPLLSQTPSSCISAKQKLIPQNIAIKCSTAYFGFILEKKEETLKLDRLYHVFYKLWELIA